MGSLWVEKSFGIWSREFSRAYTPAMSGLDRFVAWDRDGFIGRDAALADPSGFEPIHADGRFVGYVTSGAYGHTLGESLALGYVDSAVVEEHPALTVDVIGQPRPARIIPSSPHDPSGARMRA